LGTSTTFVYNFADPATVWSYNVISVHHDIFWFIIIILALVYWALYKILKDYGWNCFNKQVGLSRIFFYTTPVILWMETFIIFFWFKIFYKIADIVFWVFSNIINSYLIKLINLMPLNFKNTSKDNKVEDEEDENMFYEDLNFFLFSGDEYSDGLVYSFWVKKWKFKYFRKLLKQKYLTYFLYSYSSNAIFFNGYNDDFLTVHRFHDSTKLEFVYAIFPTIVIGFILLPSIYLLYSLDDNLEPKFVIKIYGHQWFWSYEFDNLVEFSNTKSEIRKFTFDSVMVLEEDLRLGEKRLLEVNNRLILPTDVTLRFVISSADVLHSWSIPEMGIKMDAVPGRLNQFITLICKPGIYYGQCSELCGVAHGFMPIVVHAVPYDVFIKYLG
jgi:cytochrome c oxidase subunit 2